VRGLLAPLRPPRDVGDPRQEHRLLRLHRLQAGTAAQARLDLVAPCGRLVAARHPQHRAVVLERDAGARGPAERLGDLAGELVEVGGDLDHVLPARPAEAPPVHR
jgi:hypothetical protein